MRLSKEPKSFQAPMLYFIKVESNRLEQNNCFVQGKGLQPQSETDQKKCLDKTKELHQNISLQAGSFQSKILCDSECDSEART